MAARRNVLETMEDCELIKRYRLNREGMKLVVELVRDAITSPTYRNNPISPEIKCLATYLATGKMQFCNADDLEILQPSFIRFPLEINNYTGSKPTSWHAGMLWSVLLTGRT
ncbi:hypothetical protein N1851_014211 [Merluccius polli]|uniref:Uncharacterized protein n=1 Tax=Merluccius polli TaxID=89951 RepID=A0AA47MIR2_MERPO|nr:hypothetical protein N1851_029456 [Merluccius polli]KAK0141053.1 hypothetical protein N1851_021962 [Merluccius polli]KAK0141542.1 hypothetical protein N1851_021307 [Merluccius polli]KAK0146486.1 hypothetical protein N1851_014211 [Merluccius polli]